MITAPSNAFYILNAQGEAAELITALFSPGVMGDIVDVSVLSCEFTNDIAPIHELQTSIDIIKCGLTSELVESMVFNPLYMPMPIEALDDSLEIDARSENIGFTGMNGSPYTLQLIEIKSQDAPLISAHVSYKPFDMPSYEFIMEKQNTLLN